MEKPKDGEGAKLPIRGLYRCQPWDKRVRRQGNRENMHVEVACQDRRVYSNFVPALFRYHAQIVRAGCLLQYSLHLHRDRDMQSEEQSWNTTHSSCTVESHMITDHPINEYSGNHPSSDTQDNIHPHKIPTDERLNGAAQTILQRFLAHRQMLANL